MKSRMLREILAIDLKWSETNIFTQSESFSKN